MRIQLSDHFTYRRLFRFVLPSVAMVVFTSIHGVVDGMFILNYVGKTPFAAINLIMPFMMVLGGFGFMLGTGGSVLVAKTLGEGKREQANKTFSLMVCTTALLGVVLSALGFIFLEKIALLLGATPGMLPHCLLYGRIITACVALFMLQNVFQSLLIVAEKPKLGLAATVSAGCTNMVLDALFVGVFRWGVAGAAAATVISQFVGTLIPLIYFLRPNNSLLRLCRPNFDMKAVLQACANGSSELMSNISMSLVGMVYNLQLIRFAGEDGVAAYGVIMYVNFIYVSIFIGYSIGCAPIVSYHYGAQNHGELKNMLRKSLLVMSVAGASMVGVALLISDVMAGLFVGYDAALREMTAHAFRIYAVSFILTGINIFSSSFFTALNNGGISAAISFLRTLVFQLAAVIILPIFFKIDGIWLAITVAELCAFTVSACFLWTKRKKYHYA